MNLGASAGNAARNRLTPLRPHLPTHCTFAVLSLVLALECAAQVPQQNLEVRFRQVASDQALHDPSQPGQAPADVTVSTRRPMADNRAPPPRRRHTDRQQKRDRIDVSTWMP